MAHKEIVSIAHVAVKDRGFNVHVSLNMLNHALHVFKYNEDSSVCQYEIFADHSHARAWIEHPLPESKPKHY
jgi:putative heme degradation protein